MIADYKRYSRYLELAQVSLSLGESGWVTYAKIWIESDRLAAEGLMIEGEIRMADSNRAEGASTLTVEESRNQISMEIFERGYLDLQIEQQRIVDNRLIDLSLPMKPKQRPIAIGKKARVSCYQVSIQAAGYPRDILIGIGVDDEAAAIRVARAHSRRLQEAWEREALIKGHPRGKRPKVKLWRLVGEY